MLKDHHYDPWNWHEYLADEPEVLWQIRVFWVSGLRVEGFRVKGLGFEGLGFEGWRVKG